MGISAAIIGGGYGGLVCAYYSLKKGIAVTVFERQEKTAKKLLMTGNGRCNISNVSVDVSDYLTDDDAKLSDILSSFDRQTEAELFKEIGLELFPEEGRLYPLSGKAVTVREAFMASLYEKGCSFETGVNIDGYNKTASGKYILSGDNKKREFDAIVLSCGGAAGVYDEERKNGFGIIGSKELNFIPLRPALTRLFLENVYGTNLKALEGIRIKGKVSLTQAKKIISEDTGEIQFIKGGLSGIPVFNVSRYVEKNIDLTLSLDMLPGMEFDEFASRVKRFEGRTLETFFYGLFLNEVAGVICASLHLSVHRKMSDLSEAEVLSLYDRCRHFEFKDIKTDSLKNAQISAGGIALSALDEHLALKCDPSVYVIGEMLNVSGKCGGYNLHFAAAGAYRVAASIGGMI